jgi:hypothetical protein
VKEDGVLPSVERRYRMQPRSRNFNKLKIDKATYGTLYLQFDGEALYRIAFVDSRPAEVLRQESSPSTSSNPELKGACASLA